MDRVGTFLVVVIVLVVGLAGGYWFARLEPAAPVPAAPAPLPVAETQAETGPQYPMAPAELPETGERELVPLPPLDDSDGYFQLSLVDVFGGGIEQLLASEALIDRFVTTIDNLPRGHVAESVRPVGRLADTFVVTPDGDDAFLLSEENFARYNSLVTLFVEADPDLVVETYQRFYPLLQQSYRRLGYPDGYFNDRVVEVIDHLLQTPEPADPVQLNRPHVLYKFANADLEALSSGQKLLIRMGPTHTRAIKQKLSLLQQLITAPARAED